MSVITVTGEISADKLGITDIHEHILCDFSKNHEPSGGHPDEEKIEITNLGVVTDNPLAVKDNLVLSDVDLAIQELGHFGKAGGGTIVDLTTVEIGRNPSSLRRISFESGINIVTCTGHYIQSFQSPATRALSVEAQQEEMLKEIRQGIGDTDVRAGVIGEIGSSERLYPGERRGLIAAARVNSTVGVPVIVHTEPKSRLAMEILDLLSENGADLSKVSLCHMDSDFMELEYHEGILQTGANIEFDTFGENFCLHPNYGPSDLDRIKRLCTLIDKGYVSQLMLGCDICLKCRLHAYGGWGYDHLLSNVLPAMKRLGISEHEIEVMLVQNPREFLDF
jgi:phosphotriesterase-related protein